MGASASWAQTHTQPSGKRALSQTLFRWLRRTGSYPVEAQSDRNDMVVLMEGETRVCTCWESGGGWKFEESVVLDRKRVLGRKGLLDDANAVDGEAGRGRRIGSVKTPAESEVAHGSGPRGFSHSQTAGRRTAQVRQA